WLAAQHPEGVAEQLGERAERASAGPKAEPATQTSDGDQERARDDSIEVQTLATRPAFAAMLQESDDEPSTRRMQARDLEPGRVLESAQTPRRFGAWRVAVGIVALVALSAGAAMIWPKAPRTSPLPTHPQQVAEVPDANVEARVDASVDATSARAVAADAGVDPRPDAARPIRQMATLTVTATPWANVRLDGRALGTTPLRSRRVSAGGHTLTFDNPPLGRRGRRRLRLSPGQTLWIRLDLAHDPPSVLER
ncbi:MAG: hypothetical protein GXP55_00425, partial [Deltaproteobacteria bacterium]|nr:hypothetical protein [Deltaproteobacteria bacterium]